MGICGLLLSFPQFGDFTLMHEYGSFGIPGRHNEFTILPCITQDLICNFLRKSVDFQRIWRKMAIFSPPGIISRSSFVTERVTMAAKM